MADLIDRQAAIKAIEDLQDCYNGFSDTYDKACIIGVIEEIPPAQTDQQECEKGIFKPFKQFQPIQRTGRWIIDRDSTGCMYGRCTSCGMKQYEGRTKYCPNCGAKMEEQE